MKLYEFLELEQKPIKVEKWEVGRGEYCPPSVVSVGGGYFLVSQKDDRCVAYIAPKKEIEDV